MSLWIYLSWIFHINGIKTLCGLFAWLLSLSIMFLRLIQVVYRYGYFLFMAELYSIVCTDHNLFIHSSTEELKFLCRGHHSQEEQGVQRASKVTPVSGTTFLFQEASWPFCHILENFGPRTFVSFIFFLLSFNQE